MIRINLLGEQRDNSRSHALQMIGFGLSVVASIGLCFMLQLNVNQQVDLSQAEKASLETELNKLKKVTAEVADLESKKKLLRERVTTIANLSARKQGPVHTLDDLNIAMPQKTWLTSIKEKSGQFEISGIALDNQTIAEFMKTLEKSDYFGTVDLIQASQTTIEGVKLKQFSILAQLTNPRVKELPKDEPSVLAGVPSAKPDAKKPEAAAAGKKKKFDI